MRTRQIVLTVMLSVVTTLAVAWGISKFSNNTSGFYAGQSINTVPSNYSYADFKSGDLPPGSAIDFTVASAASIPTVVHIKTKINARQVTNNTPRSRNDPFSDFFGDDMFDQLFGNGGTTREQRASGSGVIISNDGYIVTNNHVVDKADEVMVTLSNKRSYKAKVVGTDPAYDLAVIKVEAEGLPYLVYGNSDEAKIGQWVLAIGYPLNLETTVTAGIISAKARSLGLNKDRSGMASGAVESYIQTDAAVNAGNSGGALVNTEGRLIGINSAIASPTGYYSGYSYAIPVNIVRKVVDDIIKYGTVQSRYLGVQYDPSNSTPEQKKAYGIPDYTDGIFVLDVPRDGGAYEAGIRKGDILKGIAGIKVGSGAELNEVLSRFKPGDKVPITYARNNVETTVQVTLKNKSGNYDIVKSQTSVDKLGADFLALDPNLAKQYGVEGGVILKRLIPSGLLAQQTTIKENFIVLKVNNKTVKNLDELKTEVNKSKNITLTGFFPGYDGLYDYSVSLN